MASRSEDAPRTYQLRLRLTQPARLVIGRLGTFGLPAGDYVYTGSARRNLEARIARHLRPDKPPHWHIDYLLAAPGVTVLAVTRSAIGECALNQATPGSVPVPRFGASDCRMGCGSHLKYLGVQVSHRSRRYATEQDCPRRRLARTARWCHHPWPSAWARTRGCGDER